MKTYLTKSQVAALSPEDLLKYKKKLEKLYKNIESDIKNFLSAYKNVQENLQEKLEFLERSLEKIQEERLTSEVYDFSYFNLQ